MQVLALGSQKLIRNLSVQNRILYREDAINNYYKTKNSTKSQIKKNEIIVLVIQWLEGGYWKNKSLISHPSFQMGRLINSKIFKQNQKQSINFCTAKGQRMLTAMMKIGELYEKYHDRDDKMLYFRLIRQNSF